MSAYTCKSSLGEFISVCWEELNSFQAIILATCLNEVRSIKIPLASDYLNDFTFAASQASTCIPTTVEQSTNITESATFLSLGQMFSKVCLTGFFYTFTSFFYTTFQTCQSKISYKHRHHHIKKPYVVMSQRETVTWRLKVAGCYRNKLRFPAVFQVHSGQRLSEQTMERFVTLIHISLQQSLRWPNPRGGQRD